MNEQMLNETMTETRNDEMNEQELENVSGGIMWNRGYNAAVNAGKVAAHVIVGRWERILGRDLNGNHIIGW